MKRNPSMLVGLIATVLFALFASLASAQTGCGACACDSLGQFNYVPGQFARGIYRIQPSGIYDSTDLLDQRLYVPMYLFEYQSDSGDVRLMFGDFRKNRISIPLHNWCQDKAWNFSSITQDYINEVSTQQFSSISRTRNFTVAAGDTIEFFRRFLLYDHHSKDILWNRWRASDDVAFSVDIVDTIGKRIDLLDTFRISKYHPSGKPFFFTRYQSASKVRYVVPNGNVGGGRVTVRCNVYTHNGSGEPYTRLDEMMYSPAATISNYAGVWKFLSINNQAASSGDCNVPVSVGAGSIVIGDCLFSECYSASVLTPYGESIATVVLSEVGLPHTVSTPSGGYVVAFRNVTGSVLCTKLVFVP